MARKILEVECDKCATLSQIRSKLLITYQTFPVQYSHVGVAIWCNIFTFIDPYVPCNQQKCSVRYNGTWYIFLDLERISCFVLLHKIEEKYLSSWQNLKPRRLIYSRALVGLAARFKVLQTHTISIKTTKSPTTMRVLATDIVWVPFLDTTRNTTGHLSVQQSTITHTEITYSPAMVVIVIIVCESGGKLDALDPKKVQQDTILSDSII